jgi:8-oxo-dGTP diphosphatase
MKPILATMTYCLRNGQVLLMRRNKEPNLDLWIGPGGKVEPGESPHAGAQRELREETGLLADGLRLRGLITEVSPRPDWQWLLFLYVTQDFSGELSGNDREGTLRWWPVDEVTGLALPPADRVFFPRVIDLEQPIYEATYAYNADLELKRVTEH